MSPAMPLFSGRSRKETEIPRAESRTTGADVILFPGIRAEAALRHLTEAADFARELDRDPWDFAVEIQTFRELGLTNNDFRWLVCKGLVEHRQEITAIGDTCRVFRPDRPLSFSENTCFVLSNAGLPLACGDSISREASESAPRVSRNAHSKELLLPKWDRERQELRLGDIVIKQFKVPALNQERILAAFEEEGWPVVIDDPLPPHPTQDPKRRLHDTIISLNRSRKSRLMHFLGNGNGQGVRWKLNQDRP